MIIFPDDTRTVPNAAVIAVFERQSYVCIYKCICLCVFLYTSTNTYKYIHIIYTYLYMYVCICER